MLSKGALGGEGVCGVCVCFFSPYCVCACSCLTHLRQYLPAHLHTKTSHGTQGWCLIFWAFSHGELNIQPPNHDLLRRKTKSRNLIPQDFYALLLYIVQKQAHYSY